MKRISVNTSDLASTFSLIMRHDTHYFIKHDLPEFLDQLTHGHRPFSKYFARIRSGEYIPKSFYSDKESKFVYLTIGQFSGDAVDLSDLTYLDVAGGEKFREKAITKDCLIITRSGTVGICHIFIVSAEKTDDEVQEAINADDLGPGGAEKIFIPSHHLSVIELPHDSMDRLDFLRLFLQSDFARSYFWAFASGKGQKEISNWSIRTLPIPDHPKPVELAEEAVAIEKDIARLRGEIAEKEIEKQNIVLNAVVKRTFT